MIKRGIIEYVVYLGGAATAAQLGDMRNSVIDYIRLTTIAIPLINNFNIYRGIVILIKPNATIDFNIPIILAITYKL